MLHLFANPGIFHQTETPSWLFLLQMLSFVLVLISIFFIATVIFGAYLAPRKIIIAIILLILVTGVSITASILSTTHEDVQERLLQAKYDSSFINWLDAGYGIKTNPDIAQRLVNGESFATTYHGKEIVISVIETIDKKLAVVDQNHTVLKTAE